MSNVFFHMQHRSLSNMLKSCCNKRAQLPNKKHLCFLCSQPFLKELSVFSVLLLLLFHSLLTQHIHLSFIQPLLNALYTYTILFIQQSTLTTPGFLVHPSPDFSLLTQHFDSLALFFQYVNASPISFSFSIFSFLQDSSSPYKCLLSHSLIIYVLKFHVCKVETLS